ncbi:hypothetical protein VKS41_008351 [Umbelopsis sp. WA50703]
MAYADRPCEIFPSSPNWFSTCITALCPTLGLYVYASRNKVIALNTSTLRVKTSFVASQHKLHAIDIHGTTCFTTGQDKAVRSWDLQSGKVQAGHTRHQVKVNEEGLDGAVKWPKLASGSRDGTLVVWDVQQENVFRKVTPPKDKQLTNNQQARSFMATTWSVNESDRLYFTSYK